MTGQAPALGPIDYALLGLLCARPRHGYDLAAAFRPTADLGQISALPRTHLYGHLHRLERLGLVAGTAERVGRFPTRRVLRPTESGASAFRRWLDRPVARIRDVRMAFLLKLYFSERTPGHDTAALVEAQLDACRRYLAARRRERDEAAPGSFAQLVGRVRVAAAAATIGWLARYRAERASPRGERAGPRPLPIDPPPASLGATSQLVTSGAATPGRRAGGTVTYVICEPCISVKDASCVDVCPVDCIHSTDADEQYFIDPDECIDCGACEPACPVSAIFPEDSVPDNWKDYTAKNANYFKK